MRFQPPRITSIILTISFILTTPNLIGPHGLAAGNALGDAGDVVHPRSQNQDSPQFVMIFGDSFSRLGTQHNTSSRSCQPGPSAANPIGNPAWPGRTSTGGKNWVGYMISEFNHTLSLAYSFARSGSIVDPHLITPRPGPTTCFEEQTGQFNKSIGHRPDYAPWNADNAVAVIWFGVNDVRLSFTQDGIKKLIEVVVKRLFELTHELHSLGFRHFIFLEVPPLELLPTYQPRKPENIYVTLTYAIRVWNDFLVEHIERFRQEHPDSRATHVKISDIYMDAMINPESYGSPNNRCANRGGEECLWYDFLHPGKRIHRAMAERVAEAAWGGP